MQVIETPQGVILKRGANEVIVSGADSTTVIKAVLAATADEGATWDYIRSLFSRSTKTNIDALVKDLLTRRLLEATDNKTEVGNSQETPLDIFFWHFGLAQEEVMNRLRKIPLTIVGLNTISHQLVSSLQSSGHSNIQILDHPKHRNLRFFDEGGSLKPDEWPAVLQAPQIWKGVAQTDFGTCLIATSDFGGQEALCEWNTLCLDRNIHFMPVVLNDMIGYVGPMIIPGETACYACLISRQRSHSAAPNSRQFVDKAAFDGQTVNGFHPSMSSMLGAIACFELHRFYSGVLPERKAGRLIELDLLSLRMTGRIVVKLPRCAACSSLRQMSQTDLGTVLFPFTADR